MSVALSILDLAEVGENETPTDGLRACVELARQAEASGYRRVWYAEHHNIPTIASAATSVLIAHVAAHTDTIRLGSGGIMLPNHAPLVIAEQFGTLASLHPGRIDLGLGRAPGTDRQTLSALRRDPSSAERFPDDVRELAGYLSGESLLPGVAAIPGSGTNVPLYILGSSLFGAQLAAHLGLPYAFASHFAPDALQEAVAAYRTQFQPSTQLAEPHVIAGVNAIADHDAEVAEAQLQATLRRRAKLLLGRRDQPMSDADADQLLDSPAGAKVVNMLYYSAVGTPARVASTLEQFAEHARADELMVALAAPDRDVKLRTAELVAGATGIAPAARATTG